MTEGAPDGFGRTILYGYYEGAAVALACDKQGRLVFVMEKVSPFDKSGTILLHDTFGDGLVHAQLTTEGTGGSITPTPDEAVSGGHSCYLIAGSDGGRVAKLGYHFFPSAFKKIGVQFAVRFVSLPENLTVVCYYFNGEKRFASQLKYDPAQDYWQVYDYGSSTWVTILGSIGYGSVANQFFVVKLVVDIENSRYHRFRHCGGDVDVTAYDLGTLANAGFPRGSATIQVLSSSGENNSAYLDDVIITQDES